MNKLLRNFLLLFSVIISLTSNGQNVHFNCGLSDRLKELYAADPKLEADQNQMINNARQIKREKGATAVVYTIPIVFHIIHQYGTENISDKQVYDQVSILNRDFRLLNADTADIVTEFKKLKADISVEFKLASIDPYGNCTNGIEHIYSHETNNGDDYSKLNGWHRDKYLNVWVVSSMKDGVAGYAFYPSAVDGLGFIRDGIIILDNFIGSTGTGTLKNSRALTHEIGHWLGLPHVWGNTNSPGVACGDDGILDTPVTKGHTDKTTGWTLADLRKPDCANFTSSVYDFNDVTISSGKIDPTEVPSNTQRLNFGSFKASGVSDNSVSFDQFSFTGWDTGGLPANNDTTFSKLTGSLNPNKYYEVVLNPLPSNVGNLAKIDFTFQRSFTGPRTYAIRSSKDGFTSNLPVSSSNAKIKVRGGNVFYCLKDSAYTLDGSYINLNPTVFSNINSPVTFRIYAWNAEDNSGSFGIDNFTVKDADPVIENIQNYMEYSYCSNMFTLDQSDLMRYSLLSNVADRSNLITLANHKATGIDVTKTSPCAPIADFKSSKNSICLNSTVQFTDVSWNAPVQSRTWTFEGGVPATSSDSIVSVSFATSGYKKIKLFVQNSTGSNELIREDYLYVSDPWADFTGPASNSLDDDKRFWFLTENPENNFAKFQVVNGKGYNNSNCFKLNNYKNVSNAISYSDDWYYNSRLGGTKDALITPSFDLSHTTNITFSFKYAYATNGTVLNTVYQADGKTVKYPADITEEVNIWVSKDCGATWGSKKTISKAALLTAGFAGNSDFSPNGINQWKTYSTTYNSSSLDKSTRFKIEFVASDVANNFYIDDINVSGTLGLVPNEINDLDFVIYPNPLSSQQSLNISYTAGENSVELILRDVKGQVVHSEKIDQTNTQVEKTLDLGKALPSACYFLEIKVGEYSTIKKVVVI